MERAGTHHGRELARGRFLDRLLLRNRWRRSLRLPHHLKETMSLELVEEALPSDAPATEVASELVDRAEISNGRSLVKLSKTEADLAALKADAAKMKFSMATTKDADATRAFRARCVSMRTALKKNCERLRAPANEFRDAVIAAQRHLTAEIEAVEAQADDVIKADESRRAAEKAERDRIAAERAAAIQIQIDAIRSRVIDAANRPSADVERLRDALRGVEITLETFGERAGEAEQMKRQTMAMLDELHAKAMAREQEAIEAAARAEAERVERERVAAEQRAEAERLAAERKALEEQQAAIRAEQAKIDQAAAAARAKADREAAEARAEQDRKAAADRAAAQKVLDDQAAELRAQREAQEARERVARQEQEDRERAARLAEQARIDAEAAAKAQAAREEAEALERSAAAERQRAREAEEAAAIAAKRVRDAAPQMLEALQNLENDDGRIPAPAWKLVCDAIAAATGEPT